MFFDKVAAGAVGKPLIALLRQRYPGRASVEDLASSSRHDTATPPEITRLIGLKFKLMVCISKKWQVKNTDELSFQINRIEETYKPELPPITFGLASGSGGSFLANTDTAPQLPLLGPVLSAISHTPPAVPKVWSIGLIDIYWTYSHVLLPVLHTNPSSSNHRHLLLLLQKSARRLLLHGAAYHSFINTYEVCPFSSFDLLSLRSFVHQVISPYAWYKAHFICHPFEEQAGTCYGRSCFTWTGDNC